MTDFEYQKLHNQVQPWDVVADAWLLPGPERRADSQTTEPRERTRLFQRMAFSRSRRHAPGGLPTWRLKARANAASES